ncbi:MAG: GNAT family N-acetyltransferase [Ilumatobacteraceae bacterium]|nr:GNAT family N-acetyltransferase [Ilumatobacteraceae bacterium]
MSAAPQVVIGPYEADRDADAVARIWREVRWIDDEETHRAALRTFLDGAPVEVGRVDGSAECAVARTMGEYDLDTARVSLCAITGVTTSHIGRKLGLASTLTSRALRAGAEDGAAISALGMFEQGFYDRFGFGTGAYAYETVFDPSSLRLDHVPYRRPERLGDDDLDEMYKATIDRRQHHGAVRLHSAEQFAAEWGFTDDRIALGYRGPNGAVSHFLVGSLKAEYGPFRVRWLIAHDDAQVLDLLRLLRELADQFHAVKMAEPAGVQLQALLDQPMRQRSRTKDAAAATSTDAIAWWQARILDLEACAASVCWPGEPVEFVVDIDDPVGRFLDPADGWAGVSGRYRVRVADPSSIERIGDAADRSSTATMEAGIGAWTRLWLGIASASTLALGNELHASPELLRALDRAIRLPRAEPGIYF